MDDVHPSIETANCPDPRAPADELGMLRTLLSTQAAAIAALESHLAAQPTDRFEAAPRTDGADAEKLAAEAAQLAVLMEDLVRREAELELARNELSDSQRAGSAKSNSLIEKRADLEELQRQNDLRNDQLRADADRLATKRAEFDERSAALDGTQQELNEAKVALARQQQQLAADRALSQIERTELESRQTQAKRDRQRLETERAQLDADLDRLASEQAAARIAAERTERDKQQLLRQEERCAEQQKQLETQRAALNQERSELKLAQESARACQSEFARAHERLEADREQVSLERDRLVALESDTKSQRRRIAREFRVQHKTHLADLESRRDELEALVTATEAELKSLATAADTERDDELACVQEEQRELHQRVAQLGKLLNVRANELRQLRAAVATLTRQRDELADRLTQAEENVAPDQDYSAIEALSLARADEVAKLRAERNALTEQLSSAVEQLEAGNFTSEPNRSDLQRRFEMAVQDLREQKERNIELENRLSRTTSAGPANLGNVGGSWESQKRLLLESLQADDDDDDVEPEEMDRRLSLEATIRITDEVVTQKDREIAELKQLLEEQAGSIGSVAIGASAIAGILDQDELITQERARLTQVQGEWREKLRQAEIDISVQRAAIARDRAQIDEKLANHQIDMDKIKDDGPAATAGKPHRRWLSRLGIKENEE
jgi:chromosome segregation ATPase